MAGKKIVAISHNNRGNSYPQQFPMIREANMPVKQPIIGHILFLYIDIRLFSTPYPMKI